MSQAQQDTRTAVDPKELLAWRPQRGEGLSPEMLRWAYAEAAKVRSLILRSVAITHAGEAKFWIGGAGEEVPGLAMALALWEAIPEVERRAIVPHYRSETLAVPLGDLEGWPEMERDVLRQLMTRATDPFSGGRQMVNHYCLPELNILPNQSPVGMQLGKAAGYAMGYKLKGIHDSVVMTILGDGTTAEGDLHDAMNAASVWDLPLLIVVTDNEIAISTEPTAGRGIQDFAQYAASFGFRHFEYDGQQFEDAYNVTLDAVRFVQGNQAPALLHARVPRLLGHSSAGDMQFRYHIPDPLLAMGQQLVANGILDPEDVLTRKESDGELKGAFQANHEGGRIFDHTEGEIERIAKEVIAEPYPEPSTVTDFIAPELPTIDTEPAHTGTTNVPMNVAVRTALDRILEEGNSAIWGQDVAKLGGVMSCTRGLQDRYPERILDAPLNEPLIVGTAMGAAMHPDLQLLPEIQFGDYSLNAMHWLVHMGNLYWTTNGKIAPNMTVRMPVDPFRGGAVYHSMSLDGWFGHIPGVVLIVPSTSFDAYGLLRTSAEYQGPVLFLEPKILYRMNKGPILPGEPEEINRVRLMQGGEILNEIQDFRIPFGRAAVRAKGDDLTIVAWGWAVHQSLEAAAKLAEQGHSVEVIDLRTLVPYDREAVEESVARTGRLLVAHPDRVFAGFGRQIQDDFSQQFPSLHSRVVGMRDLPGIPQCVELEDHVALQPAWIQSAAEELLAVPIGDQAVDPNQYVRRDDPLAWLDSTQRYRRG